MLPDMRRAVVSAVIFGVGTTVSMLVTGVMMVLYSRRTRAEALQLAAQDAADLERELLVQRLEPAKRTEPTPEPVPAAPVPRTL